MSSYLHLRDTDGKPPVAVGRDRLDDSIDIFDSIEADAPKGLLPTKEKAELNL